MQSLRLSLPILLLTLTACQTVVMTGATETAMVAAEKRTLGEAVDDVGIFTEISHYYLQTDVNDLLPHVNITVRQGRVLLTGKVNKHETAQLAERKAWEAGGVREVINEIEVNPQSGPWNRTRDEWLEKQVEGRLTVTKHINIFNLSVEVSNGTVYLLGLVQDDAEMQRVLTTTSTVRGVKRVVSHLRTFEQSSNPNPATL